MRSKRITRQWNKAFGAEVLEESLLASAPQAVRGTSAEVDALLDAFWGNLPDFLNSVDEMYGQLEEAKNLAQRSLELSSAELTEANGRLYHLNQTFDAVLNSLGQGFLILDKEGVGGAIHSRACESLLEVNPEGRAAVDILRVPPEKRESFREWYDMLFQELMDFEDLAPLGPKYFQHSKGWVVQLEYKPVRNSAGVIEFVLLIATDLTKEVQATEKAQAVQAYANFISSILKNKNRFAAFVKDFRLRIKECAELSAGSAGPNAHAPMKSLLHGLKGASGLFGMLQVERKLHAAETAVVEIQSNGESLAVLTPAIVEVSSIFENTLRENWEILADVLGADGPQRQIPLRRLGAFARELADAGQGRLAQLFVQTFIAEPAFDLLAAFNADLRQTAERLGKQVGEIEFHGENVSLEAEAYGEVFAELIHVFRNIADHGIERPDERTARGKPAAGKVEIHLARKGEILELQIRDDGAGINEERLAEKLRARGLSSASREEILDGIFRSDISTAERVTEISGRGIGLYALRASIEALGGSIRVDSVPGEGATFSIRLPVLSAGSRG